MTASEFILALKRRAASRRTVGDAQSRLRFLLMSQKPDSCPSRNIQEPHFRGISGNGKAKRPSRIVARKALVAFERQLMLAARRLSANKGDDNA